MVIADHLRVGWGQVKLNLVRLLDRFSSPDGRVDHFNLNKVKSILVCVFT